MVTINCRIRDELTKDRYPRKVHVEWQSSEQSPIAGRLGEKELVKKSEWQIEQPVRCLSRRLRRPSVGCAYFPNCNRRSSGRAFFIWLPIKRLSLRSTNRWAMSLVRCCSITPSLLILVRKDCASYLRIFTSRPTRKRGTRCVLSSSSSTPVPALKIPAVSAPQAHFEVAEDAVKL